MMSIFKSIVRDHTRGLVPNKTVHTVTAQQAGINKELAELRAAKEQIGKLEVLLSHLKSLRESGSATAIDEKIASTKTKRYLASTSAKIEISRILLMEEEPSDRCWRDVRNVKSATAASVRNVRKGLRMAKESIEGVHITGERVLRFRDEDSG